MQTIIVDASEIRLPASLAQRFQGGKVMVQETAEGILLKPVVDDTLLSARGFLKGKYSTEMFMRSKEEEKNLER